MFEEILKETRKVNEEYVPYTGGAGPSEEQVKQNNLELKKKLEDRGIESEEVTIDLDGTPIQVLKLAPGTTVGYDRWGFVGDPGPTSDFEEELDQGDLEAAIAWSEKAVKAVST